MDFFSFKLPINFINMFNLFFHPHVIANAKSSKKDKWKTEGSERMTKHAD